MENFFDVKEAELPMTMRAIRTEIQRRHWPSAKFFISTFSYAELTRPDGKVVKINSSTPSTSSELSCKLATDKYASYLFMDNLGGIPQPETKCLVMGEDYSATISAMLEKYHHVVIKPIDGAHGNNVFTDIDSLAKAEEIIDIINRNSHPTKILIQEQLPRDGIETRVLCINYQYTAAYNRIPAAVTGDGEHTVRELIDIENSTFRTAPYKGILNYIDTAASNEYLASNPIGDTVPEKGQKVQVVGICNAGKGGSMEDVTDSLPEEYRAVAERIARGFELPVIGIDFYNDKVIEVNCGPALYYPDICVEKYIDYLETL